MKLRDLLQRARKALLGWSPVETEELTTEALIRELMLDLLENPSENEVYIRAAYELLEAARGEGKEEALEELYRRIGWEPTATCKAHNKRGCPLCLNVRGCPVYDDLSIDQLRPEVLKDAERLAKAIHATYYEVGHERDYPMPPTRMTWRNNPPEYRDAMVEACRRVVVNRFEAAVIDETARREKVRDGEAE